MKGVPNKAKLCPKMVDPAGLSNLHCTKSKILPERDVARISRSSLNPSDIPVIFCNLRISPRLSHFASISQTFLTSSDPNPGISESEWLRGGESIFLVILPLFV